MTDREFGIIAAVLSEHLANHVDGTGTDCACGAEGLFHDEHLIEKIRERLDSDG